MNASDSADLDVAPGAKGAAAAAAEDSGYLYQAAEYQDMTLPGAHNDNGFGFAEDAGYLGAEYQDVAPNRGMQAPPAQDDAGYLYNAVE